ncbi:hypothetical protein pipiens_006695 [Culex pipiens pipiens]|uniref:Uncharacterized protein n=1 Tax=Culex pipiens pipiens TaxID=38569 RepID=A0ABD1DP16_CULPP
MNFHDPVSVANAFSSDFPTSASGTAPGFWQSLVGVWFSARPDLVGTGCGSGSFSWTTPGGPAWFCNKTEEAPNRCNRPNQKDKNEVTSSPAVAFRSIEIPSPQPSHHENKAV